jgi:hypothetical protein
LAPAIVIRFKDIYKVTGSSISQLIMSGNISAILIEEVGDGVSPGSFDNGLVEESGIPVPSNRPVLFVSLSMIGFFSS